MSYSFCNPDPDNIYDVFPVQKTKYAFISGYVVPSERRISFEEKWKNLARFYQKQDGYLYNKLIRSHAIDASGSYLYFDFNQWTTGDAYKIACSRSSRDELLDEIHKECLMDDSKSYRHPLMYKTVVDDTQFTPSEVIQARNPTNVVARLGTEQKVV